MIAAAGVLFGIHRYAFHKRRQGGLHMFLKEMLAAQPGRKSVQCQGTVAQVVEKVVGRTNELFQEVTFGDRGMICTGWP
jgi:hypothetical protein